MSLKTTERHNQAAPPTSVLITLQLRFTSIKLMAKSLTATLAKTLMSSTEGKVELKFELK